MPEQDFTLFLAGDALITQPWSHVEDPGFLRLVAEMRAADVSIINLETVIHDFKGYAQADSGGTYMTSPPPIAGELKWAGVDMMSSANNHAFDYGSTGILETVEHVEAAGLVLAGIGKDLQAARAPAYVPVRGATVALVSTASTFVPYGRASRSRRDMRGRPGLNPLGLTKLAAGTVTPSIARMVERLRFRRSAKMGRSPSRTVRLLGLRFLIDGKTRFGRSRGVDPADLEGNFSAIATACNTAELTVVSVHAHEQTGWLRSFAHRAIDLGAGVVFAHGPHELRGIEIHRGKPIFNCLGSFVYETDQIARYPADHYDEFGLGDDATPAELLFARRNTRLAPARSHFEGVCAILQYRNARLLRIRLIPLDLQFAAPPDRRGRPTHAAAELGREIIERIAGLSKPFGTIVRYDPARNEGIIELS